LRGKTAASTDVVDVDKFIVILSDKLGFGEDESVIAARIGVGKEG
jgi:hypothetical protein